jgi:hypothetical protein
VNEDENQRESIPLDALIKFEKTVRLLVSSRQIWAPASPVIVSELVDSV